MGSSYDGSILINTKIDNSGLDKGLKEQTNSVKSQVAKLAAEYKKQGMNASEAFKKAWSEVDRSSQKTWSGVEKSSKNAAKNSSNYWKKSAMESRNHIENISCGFNSLMSSVRKLAGVVGIVFGLHELIQFGKQAIELASDIEEVQNVVDTAFGAMSYKMEDFADTAIETYGISKLTAKQTGSTFMAMAKGMQLEEGYASDLAVSLTGLSADMASFYNVKQDVASTSLKSIFTGETETLKQFGVVMTETNLQEYAYQQGINKSISALSQKEKVMLRAQYVQKQLSMVNGDFAKTQDSWANQTRILSERWKELLSILGTGLITVLTPVVRSLNVLCANLINVANTIGKVMSEIFGIEAQSFGGSGAVSPVTDNYEDISDSAAAAAGATDKYTKSTKEAKKANEGAVASFDKIQVLQKETAGSNSNSNSNANQSGSFGGIGTVTTEAVKSAGMFEESSKKVDVLSESMRNLIALLEPATSSLKNLWNNGLKKLGEFTYKALLDFLEYFLKPVGKWVMGEGIPRFIDAINNGFMKINWSRLNGALAELWKALAPFAINVGEGLLWLFENVLVPLAAWTISDILPLFLEGLAASIKILNAGIEAFKPIGLWIFDNFLYPLAKWTGGIIVRVLTDFVNILTDIGNWMSKNIDIVKKMEIAVAGFFAAWKIVEFMSWMGQMMGGKGFAGLTIAILNNAKAWGKAIEKIWIAVSTTIGANVMYAGDFLKAIGTATKAVWSHVAAWVAANAKIVLIIAAIGLLVAGVKMLVDNWGNMNDFEKTVSVLGVVAIAAFGAALAIGAFQSALTMGIAAAAIVAGITAIAVACNSASKRANEATKSLNQHKGSGGANGYANYSGLNRQSFSLPHLAQGAVIPPNKKFAAILGDQTQGYNVEAPSELIKQMVKEGISEVGMNSAPMKIEIQFTGDNAQLARHLNPILAAESARKGVKLVTTIG